MTNTNKTTATYESARQLVATLRGELEQLTLLPSDTLEICDQLVARVELAKARADSAPSDIVKFSRPEPESVLEREKAAARRAGAAAVVEDAKAKAEFLAKTAVKGPRNPVHLVEVEEGHHVDVIPRKSIRLHGLDRNRRNGPVAYDRTFEIGDSAEYDSYNTSFIGRIVAIGAKTVTIDTKMGERRRLKLEQFSWRNRHFDLETVARRNAEESYYI